MDRKGVRRIVLDPERTWWANPLFAGAATGVALWFALFRDQLVVGVIAALLILGMRALLFRLVVRRQLQQK
jgi:hypothetical protein